MAGGRRRMNAQSELAKAQILFQQMRIDRVRYACHLDDELTQKKSRSNEFASPIFALVDDVASTMPRRTRGASQVCTCNVPWNECQGGSESPGWSMNCHQRLMAGSQRGCKQSRAQDGCLGGAIVLASLWQSPRHFRLHDAMGHL